jgi:type VI protein secretion system component Hcp
MYKKEMTGNTHGRSSHMKMQTTKLYTEGEEHSTEEFEAAKARCEICEAAEDAAVTAWETAAQKHAAAQSAARAHKDASVALNAVILEKDATVTNFLAANESAVLGLNEMLGSLKSKNMRLGGAECDFYDIEFHEADIQRSLNAHTTNVNSMEDELDLYNEYVDTKIPAAQKSYDATVDAYKLADEAAVAADTTAKEKVSIRDESCIMAGATPSPSPSPSP